MPADPAHSDTPDTERIDAEAADALWALVLGEGKRPQAGATGDDAR